MEKYPVNISSGVALVLLSLLLLPPASAQDADEGERLFRQRCAACHTVEPGQNRAGPHLDGVIGREVGTVEAARYSAAMLALDTRWDEALLDRFLSNPRQTVPGTSMVINVPNPDQRLAIAAYLRSLSNS